MNFIKKVKEKKLFLILVIIICIIIGTVYGALLAPKTYTAASSMMILKNEGTNQKEKNVGSLTLSDDIYNTLSDLIKSDAVYGKAVKNVSENGSPVELSKSQNSNIFSIQVKNYDKKTAVSLLTELNKIFSEEIKNINSSYEIRIIDEPKIVSESINGNCLLYIFASICIGIMFDTIYIIVFIISEKQYNSSKRVAEEDFTLKELVKIPYKKINDSNNINEIISGEDDFHINRNLRKLRANLQFININNSDKKTFLITSPLKGEGKTFLSINLANSFAEIGKKVIIVDCSLNDDTMSQIFGTVGSLGVSNFLSGLDNNGNDISKKIKDYIMPSNLKGIDIIPSGIIPPNSSELLSSKNLQSMIRTLSREYDIVIIDGPETLKKTDALIITRVVGTTILVADVRTTRYDDLIYAKNDVQNVGGRVVGVVVNKVKYREDISFKEFFLSIKNKFSNFFNKIKELLERIDEKRNRKLIDAPKDVEEEPKPSEQEDIVIIDNNQDDDSESEEAMEDIVDNAINDAIDDNINDTRDIEEAPTIVPDEENVVEEPAKKEHFSIMNKFSGFVNSVKNVTKTEEPIQEVQNNEEIIHDEVFDNIEQEYQDYENNYQEIDSSNNTIVVVDSESGYARAYNQSFYTEKPIRGVDKGDGLHKVYYSPMHANKRLDSLMEIYGITKEQGKRIDPLVYAILSDFDEKIWIYDNIAANNAEKYVYIMAREYDKLENETQADYQKRCKELRYNELKQNNIEIEYNLNFLKSNNTTFVDKIMMKRYAALVGYTTNQNVSPIPDYNDNRNEYNEGEYGFVESASFSKLNENSNNNVDDTYAKKKIDDLEKDNLEEINKIDDERKSYKIEVDALKKKSRIERNAIEVQKSIEENVISYEQNPEDDFANYSDNMYNMDFSNLADSKNKKDESVILKKEKKQEQQMLRKIKREKKLLKKEENKKKKSIEKEERTKKREEERKIREFKRAQEKEEARIEEELLENNLYPKTKNIKNL